MTIKFILKSLGCKQYKNIKKKQEKTGKVLKRFFFTFRSLMSFAIVDV